MGFVLKSGWATHDLELKENWLTFSHQLSGTNISLVRKSSILLLPPCWDICLSLFFFFQDKWCNLIRAFVLLDLENSFLFSSITLAVLIFLHTLGGPWDLWEWVWCRYLFRANSPLSLFSYSLQIDHLYEHVLIVIH